jgi:cellulose synthase/poly-beta-1,6-N-acetylglucosamine synthase-like glycosyltransferase
MEQHANPSVRISVIVPVHNGAGFLVESLSALGASDLPPEDWELIVVDDSSTDRSAEIAVEYADVVVRRDARAGPALARNQGVRRARGEILVFIDADVAVRRDVLRRFNEIFLREPDVAAAFGAYDTSPRAAGLVSQYRNLLHHWVHNEGAGDAETFWAGCGAMRRAAFLEAGEFDQTAQPVEDIDLGYRVRARGHRILLQPDIQGTHLKRWTLASMVATDLFGRGVTWMRLHLEQGRRGRPGTLNLRLVEKAYTLLTGLGGAAMFVWGISREPFWLALAAACVSVVLLGNLPLFRWFARQRGLRFTLAVIPLRLLYYVLNAIAAPLGLVLHLLRPRVSRGRAS